MKTERELIEMLERIKQDERLTYPCAIVDINAPLALIQLVGETKIRLLEEILGLPMSKLPLEKRKENGNSQ